MFNRILDAVDRLDGEAAATPVMTSSTLNRLVGAEVLFKCENFQKAGAFKFRGAFNAISRLTDEEKARGVITFSSGNHGQAVALVGNRLGVKTVVVMPGNAPAVKREAAEGYGALVVDYDPSEVSREEIAQRLKGERGYTLIPPYDHKDIIAGQGTAAFEFIKEAGYLDMLMVPCGGGGLLSGSAIAAKHLSAECTVIGIEPELADDATRSFHSKTRHTVHNPPTIADGLRTPSLGKLTFPLILQSVDEMKTVPEVAIVEAVQFLFYRMKIVVEPSGALGLAALLTQAVAAKGRVGVILSGGNVDGAVMRRILREDPTADANRAATAEAPSPDRDRR